MGDFSNELKACEVTAICGRTFLRIEQLKRWLGKHTEMLLWTAYLQENHFAPPIHWRQVQDPDTSSILVFSILLELGYGNLIDIFHNVQLVSGLPIPLSSLKTELGRANDSRLRDSDAEDLAEAFNKKQWRYCPPKFGLQHVKNYFPQHIVPIIKIEAINSKGGTAKVWQIVVLEDSVERELGDAIPLSRFKEKGDSLGWVSCRLASFHAATRIQ